MIALPPGARVWLACGVTDMRRGMPGLALMPCRGPVRFPRQAGIAPENPLA
jgi:transposase